MLFSITFSLYLNIDADIMLWCHVGEFTTFDFMPGIPAPFNFGLAILSNQKVYICSRASLYICVDIHVRVYICTYLSVHACMYVLV